jgi:Fe-S-cluster containining protein
VDELETELARARSLSESDLADAIEAIGFECTQCGACCRGSDCGDDGVSEPASEPHTATVFPDEVRQLQERDGYDWRDVARPMPYGLGEDGQGETFEWALQTDSCGDCTFYDGESGDCTVYGDRPLICQTYPFSVALGGTSQPMGEAVDEEGMVRAHECEGLGRDIEREEAEKLAASLKARAVRELEEAIAVRDNYTPVEAGADEVVVHDSEGPKAPDGSRRNP